MLCGKLLRLDFLPSYHAGQAWIEEQKLTSPDNSTTDWIAPIGRALLAAIAYHGVLGSGGTEEAE